MNKLITQDDCHESKQKIEQFNWMINFMIAGFTTSMIFQTYGTLDMTPSRTTQNRRPNFKLEILPGINYFENNLIDLQRRTVLRSM